MDDDFYIPDEYDPWNPHANVDKNIKRLTHKYLRAYNYLENLARNSPEGVPAKTVQDTLMEIFRWEIIERFHIPFSVNGPNAVTLYQPLIYKAEKYIPFVGDVISKFLQNSLFLIFDKFKADPTEEFDDAYYFKIVDFMKKLAEYINNINKSFLSGFVFNNTIAYVEYKVSFPLRETGNYYVYFRPLRPDKEDVEMAMEDLYYNAADLAGKAID
ncbi:MAG: hypothetical protein NV1_06 [Nanoarchaeotal virus 1]|nr:MAG: hypothetical protein NV1_06 [Nanoarchaeotal virus 1]